MKLVKLLALAICLLPSIELIEGGKKWKLTADDSRSAEDCQICGRGYWAHLNHPIDSDLARSQGLESHPYWPVSQGNVGQVAGAVRKPSQPEDAPLREVAESSQSGHGFAPSPANSGDIESCGDNLHASRDTDAVILPAGLSDCESGLSAFPAMGTQCEKSCSTVEGHGLTEHCPASQGNLRGVQARSTQSGYQASPTGLKTSDQIGAEAATDGDHSTCYGSTPSRAETLCAGDVPQPLSAESMSCGAATGKDEGAATSREANGRQIKIAQQDCGSVEAFPRIPQVSSIRDGAEGDDRAAGLDILSPEFHAVHIADEGANSTRAWWGELEREAQEAIAGELVSNERWR